MKRITHTRNRRSLLAVPLILAGIILVGCSSTRPITLTSHGMGAGQGVGIGALTEATADSRTTADFQARDSAEDAPNLPEITVNTAIEERRDPLDNDERQREQWW